MFEKTVLKDQHILVTGGGTGLGYSMARTFARLGADVTLWGRRKAILDDAAAMIRDEAQSVRIETDSVDIRNADAIEAAIDRIWNEKPLTGLVNNAAGNFISPTEKMSTRGFDAIASIVFHGTFYVTHACARRWIETDMPASVLSILTTWVWTGSPFVVPSAMSKAGLAAMTQSLAVEWGPKGLRFNAIAPGPFPTKGAWDRLLPGGKGGDDLVKTNPMRRVGDHAELANLATFLMAPGASYINGAIIPIDGGQWLNNAGSFAHLWDVSDAEWAEMRNAIQAATAKDKGA